MLSFKFPIFRKYILFTFFLDQYVSYLNNHLQKMSSAPRISFNKPKANPTYQISHLQNTASLKRPTMQVSTTAAVNVAEVQPVLSPHKAVAAERSSLVEEIPRPQYEKTYNTIPAYKRLAPQKDPAAKQTCCVPCWWVVIALIGLAGLTLALLYGLNVIWPSTSLGVKSVASSSSPTATTSNSPAAAVSSTTPTSATTTTTSNANTSATPPSIPAVTPTKDAASHLETSADVAPSGTTKVSQLPDSSESYD